MKFNKTNQRVFIFFLLLLQFFVQVKSQTKTNEIYADYYAVNDAPFDTNAEYKKDFIYAAGIFTKPGSNVKQVYLRKYGFFYQPDNSV